MRIHKVGRRRPILYTGQFSVPNSVVSRIAIAKNHHELAKIAHFNGKINQYYMTIDNLLAAVITAKEGCLTTTKHPEKIRKFFTYMGKKAQLRNIDHTDFEEFYQLWADSRYSVYFPKPQVVERIRLFTDHLFSFVNTEIARFYKSDETLLEKQVDNQLKVYNSECIEREASFFHERRQIEAEEIGDGGGPGLGMKLSNPWNFIDLSLVSDRKDVCEIIDNSEEVKKATDNILKNWEDLIAQVSILLLSKTALEVADAKAKRKSTTVEAVLPEAVEIAGKNPAAHRFRLVLDLSYDVSEPQQTVEKFSMLMKAARDRSLNPKKAELNGWELLKKYSSTTSDSE
jgi:hypothetical protein